MADKLKLDNSWLGGDGMDKTGTTVMVRYRPNLQGFIDSSKYQTRIDLDWLYDDTGDGAYMPSSGEQTGMEELEEALGFTFADDNQSILVFVYTSQGTRRWVWYTQDSHEAEQRMQEVINTFTDFDISITHKEDPEWKEYFGLIERYEDNSTVQ
ncbi:DUF695 domain-containing protein [Mucilaginibacter glaciei]|uniref:DUF695 domain-containing protein n=1 Tax=Mucilaginibacter glaciei TaxID=2772109 RepID=A0A926NNN4_9SPHI|nr:DUF695 domain-containing protein [Mucilaginibacter glaciei]MBD1394506.1 DUF695 domain-containing protein [Mucilaginibacter glaciei]